MLTIEEVTTRRHLKEFIYLPAAIHRKNKRWLPPIYSDEWKLFDKKRNESFAHADTVMFLARRGGKPCGRIMGIISHRYNQLHNEKDGRFCFLETVDDYEVVSALTAAVAGWAAARGMNNLVGPLGFSDKDPQGLQVEGFEYSHIMTAPTNEAYLPLHLEKEGFVKKRDLVNYLLDMPGEVPPIYTRIEERFKLNGSTEILEFRSTRELKPYIMEILQLMNDTFTEIYGFIPLTEREKQELAKRYLPILDPAFIKVARVSGRLAGFAIGMPDISEGIRRSGGYLLPLGIFHIIKSSKRSDTLLMLLGGILKEYRGTGVDALLGSRILRSALQRGMKRIDSHLVLETNSRMRAEYEKMNGKIVRRYRIYTKELIQ